MYAKGCRRSGSRYRNGRRGIRTPVDIVSRFTVCPRWPLEYPPLDVFRLWRGRNSTGQIGCPQTNRHLNRGTRGPEVGLRGRAKREKTDSVHPDARFAATVRAPAPSTCAHATRSSASAPANPPRHPAAPPLRPARTPAVAPRARCRLALDRAASQTVPRQASCDRRSRPQRLQDPAPHSA